MTDLDNMKNLEHKKQFKVINGRENLPLINDPVLPKNLCWLTTNFFELYGND